MDEENMAIEGLVPGHAGVSFRGSVPFQPGGVTLGYVTPAGSVIGARGDRIGRWKDAVIYRAGFVNEANPLELGFRNKSHDLAHPDSL
jgi:hypothetical protein